MGRSPPTKRLRDVAAKTEVTAQQLQDIIEKTQKQIELTEYLNKGWNDPESGVRVVFRNPPSDYVFAISPPIWDSIVDGADFDEKEIKAAKEWHMARGRDLAITNKMGGTTDLEEGELYLVIRLPLVENWQWVESDLSMWFEQLGEQGLTPAEMLDFWAIETCGYSPREWSESRGVTPEAVRKNARQAKQKISDPSLYPSSA